MFELFRVGTNVVRSSHSARERGSLCYVAAAAVAAALRELVIRKIEVFIRYVHAVGVVDEAVVTCALYCVCVCVCAARSHAIIRIDTANMCGAYRHIFACASIRVDPSILRRCRRRRRRTCTVTRMPVF